MTTITKDDFLSMVRLQHLEVLTSEQLAQNTAVLKGYMEKALTSELSDLEKADSNVMIAEVGSLQQWCVLRNDFSKAVVYTRREQIAWDEPERGEFGEILKARGGVYKPTVEIKAPMVGTFYRSPSPEAAPYVNVGDSIEPGQVICIIEAMKLMNEIKSEVKGKIVEIQADNAEPVEFGQLLFVIEPAV